MSRSPQSQSQLLAVEEQTGQERLLFPRTSVHLSSGEAGWSGIEVEQVVLNLETPEHHHEGHFLTLHLGSPALVEWKQERGGRHVQARLLPGEFSLIGAGMPHEVRYDSAEVLALSLEPHIVQQAAGEDSGSESVELMELNGVSDRQIERFCQLLKSELEMGAPSGRLFGDAIGQALSAHLLAHYSVPPGKKIARSRLANLEPANGLDPSRLRKSIEFLQENLERDVTLTEVAGIVGLSPHHFARQFKAATGKAPHAYLIERRVARAQELLQHTTLPIAQIATIVGFTHQSHLTSHFRRLIGVTPARFRNLHSSRSNFVISPSIL